LGIHGPAVRCFEAMGMDDHAALPGISFPISSDGPRPPAGGLRGGCDPRSGQRHSLSGEKLSRDVRYGRERSGLARDHSVTYNRLVSNDDLVFKALADPTRRLLLDRLF